MAPFSAVPSSACSQASRESSDSSVHTTDLTAAPVQLPTMAEFYRHLVEKRWNAAQARGNPTLQSDELPGHSQHQHDLPSESQPQHNLPSESQPQQDLPSESQAGEPPKKRRRQFLYTSEQKRVLSAAFELDPYPLRDHKKRLAALLDI